MIKDYSPQELCAEVLKLVDQTGDFILSEGKKFNRNTVETKSKNSLVSYVDKTAEQQLVDGLSALIPESGFIAEEGTSTKNGEIWNWIIDPLDGTTNFIHGIPVFSISIALQRGNKIVLGVVKELNRDESFYSYEGGPAFLNGEEISVGKSTKLADSLIATGFPYHDYDRLEAYIKLLQDFMHESRGVRRMGSAAVDLAYVACGRFDGFFEYSLNAWDVAAGGFIVKQAGGVVTDFEGEDEWLFGNEILACSKAVYEEFSKKAARHFTN